MSHTTLVNLSLGATSGGNVTAEPNAITRGGVNQAFGTGGVFIEVRVTILQEVEIGCHENLYEGLKSDRTPISVVNIT
jgi:hypothetical protein